MINKPWTIIVAFVLSTCVSANPFGQIPFHSYKSSSSDSDHETFTVLHASHPSHSLTITPHRKSPLSTDATSTSSKPDIFDVCPGASDGYTGYLHSGSAHFYFAFFTSRDSPSTDPLLMWLNGGPGCSSMLGAFMELGPCSITNSTPPSAVSNPHSWINHASIFFLDQPIGVGFSYSSDPNLTAHGTFAASEDIYAFMQLWYTAFPETRSLPFNIAGESYAGIYIPVFAKHIVDMNAVATIETQIPLKSVMIGNGIYSMVAQSSSAWDIACTNATGIGPVITNATVCEQMESSVVRSERLMRACSHSPDPLICKTAYDFAEEAFGIPFYETGLNVYDVSKKCEGFLCYPILRNVIDFLRLQKVRDAMGVDPSVSKFEGCSEKVSREFGKVNDGLIDTRSYVTALLEAGIRVQVYQGTYDWICNFVGVERVFGNLPWSGMPGFRYAQENGKKSWSGGLWWEGRNALLRYTRINGAGHMVPYDRPVEALKIFKAWIDEKPLE